MSALALPLVVPDFECCSVAVVGDLILDRYIWGTSSRISPEAPVPVVRVQRETTAPGGAANVVRNLLSLGARASTFGMVGDDPHGACLRAQLSDSGADVSGILVSPDRRTTVKTRVLAGNQQVVRIDREDARSAGENLVATLRTRLMDAIVQGRVQAVILEDYAKGLLVPGFIEAVVRVCRSRGVVVCMDPHPANAVGVKGLTLLTPNRAEAYALAGAYDASRGVPFSEDAELHAVAGRILAEWEPEVLLVTLGSGGMGLFQVGHPPLHIPTKAKEVFDVSGAGDTVAATFTLALSCGTGPALAAAIANHAAGIVVGKLGTATATVEELEAAIRFEQAEE